MEKTAELFISNFKKDFSKRPPRRGIEPRSPAFCNHVTGGDTDHYTIEEYWHGNVLKIWTITISVVVGTGFSLYFSIQKLLFNP